MAAAVVVAKAVAKGVAGKDASYEATRGRRGDELPTALTMSWSECYEFPPSVLCPFVVMDVRLRSLSAGNDVCVCFVLFICNFCTMEEEVEMTCVFLHIAWENRWSPTYGCVL